MSDGRVSIPLNVWIFPFNSSKSAKTRQSHLEYCILLVRSENRRYLCIVRIDLDHPRCARKHTRHFVKSHWRQKKRTFAICTRHSHMAHLEEQSWQMTWQVVRTTELHQWWHGKITKSNLLNVSDFSTTHYTRHMLNVTLPKWEVRSEKSKEYSLTAYWRLMVYQMQPTCWNVTWFVSAIKNHLAKEIKPCFGVYLFKIHRHYILLALVVVQDKRIQTQSPVTRPD